MNAKKYFSQLYTYNAWASELLYSFLREGAYQNKKIDMLFSHVTIAQLTWHNRIMGQPKPKYGLFDTIPTDELLQLNEESNEAWNELVLNTSKKGFKEVIAYVDSRGENHETQLRDILTHVANHGSHHRGQILTLIRNEDITPPQIDFIFFTRV